MKKISILLPTYNDADFIEKTLISVANQTYKNWEILICDDGSVDNTKEVVQNFINKNKLSKKIKYIYQENKDQLNALINILQYASGDYAYILHSDDLLNDENTLKKCIESISDDYDAIISDLTIIDNNDQIIGTQKVGKYKNKKSLIPLQLLWLGRNLYNDFPFAKLEVFKNNIYENYLIWNGPFWLNIRENNVLNVKTVDFPIRKYRVNDQNYISTPIGKLNVINGEIRVVTSLLSKYYIPLYKAQYIIFRIFNKLNLLDIYSPIYFKKETKNKYNVLKFILNKAFTDQEIKENLFLDSLLNFYKNNLNRSINVNIPKDTIIYYGKDMRVFNKKILNNSLEKFYINFLGEMKKGFNEIVVQSESDMEKIKNICKFLCIDQDINIKYKK